MTEPTGVNTNTQTSTFIYACTFRHAHTHTHKAPQKLIIKWFCFLDLIFTPIWQVQSSSFILIQSGTWLALSTDTLSLVNKQKARTHTSTQTHACDAPPLLVCRNERRPSVVEEGGAKKTFFFLFITPLSAAHCILLILTRGSLHLGVSLRV